MRSIYLALGANRTGPWGCPVATLRRAVVELGTRRLAVTAASSLYETDPVGGPAQAKYVNAVVRVTSDLSPIGILRAVKAIEQAAGRRTGTRWGARALDIDIIADHGHFMGWHRPVWPRDRKPGNRSSADPPRERLTIPHPRLHRRAFVLIPLLDIAPAWRHAALDHSARHLLATLPRQRRGVRLLHRAWLS